MSVDKRITDYRAAKREMEEIMSKHVAAAFAEVREKFGICPHSVDIRTVLHHEVSVETPSVVFQGVDVYLADD